MVMQFDEEPKRIGETMKNLFRLLLGVLVIFGFSITSSFSKSVDSLHCGTLDFPPYAYEDKEKLKGIEIEVVREIGRRLKIDIKLELLPWKRLLEKTKFGKIDCMFGAFRTEKRVIYLDFTTVPIHVSSLVLFVHQDRPIRFSTLEDLKGLEIGLVIGFKTSPEFDRALQKKWFYVESVPTMEMNFRKLAGKRMHAVVANRQVGASLIKKLGLSHIIALPTPITARSAQKIVDRYLK